ncbi:MAG: M28 family peptidase [Anaerolineales bacterium]|nr:M28 family peptidase [Anaerolineales bacterium]
MNHKGIYWLGSWMTILSLAIFTLPYSDLRRTDGIVPSKPPALVRIDLANEAELGPLADAGIEVYAQLYTPTGGVYLLMPAEESQQDDLARQGYVPRVIDADASGANYYLLYGLPEDLQRAGDLVEILLVEGRQAVARAQEQPAERLASLGIKTLPLHLQRLVAPASPKAPLLPSSVTPNPSVEAMLSLVDSDTLYTQVGNLSGQWPVNISGSPYRLYTRYTYTDIPIKKATRYAYEYFQSLGLPSGYDYYYISGYEKRNVLAEQVGLAQPGRIFLLTAHLDSYSGSYSYSLAPGADDNASGSAALMHIADILSHYDFACTLRYALFTGEEQGMIGSNAYAADVFAAGEDVEAVLNMDMLAYNTPGTRPKIELHTRPGNVNDLAIANLFADVIPAYQINLVPMILQDGETFSDHSSFWQRGYPAILAIEDWNDHTPYYHTTNDRLGTINMGYYTEFVKAALATFAHMGCLLEGRLAGTVRDLDSSDPLPGVSVQVKTGGQTVLTTNTGADGKYSGHLPPGDYTVVFSALDYQVKSIENVHIAHDQTTQLNTSLQPCTWLKGASVDSSPFWPQIGETVTFTATLGAGQTPVSYSWNFGDGQSGNGQSITHFYSAQGGYLASMTASNACGVPATVFRLVPVEVELYYLPMVSK